MQSFGCRESVQNIAELFRVRQQRVMAIIALAMGEEDCKAKGYPMHEHFRVMMEGDYLVEKEGDFIHSGIDPCSEAVGSGEKHVRILPRAPHYEVCGLHLQSCDETKSCSKRRDSSRMKDHKADCKRDDDLAFN